MTFARLPTSSLVVCSTHTTLCEGLQNPPQAPNATCSKPNGSVGPRSYQPECALCRTEHMLKEEALGRKKVAVRRKAVAMLQQAQASLKALIGRRQY